MKSFAFHSLFSPSSHSYGLEQFSLLLLCVGRRVLPVSIARNSFLLGECTMALSRKRATQQQPSHNTRLNRTIRAWQIKWMFLLLFRWFRGKLKFDRITVQRSTHQANQSKMSHVHKQAVRYFPIARSFWLGYCRLNSIHLYYIVSILTIRTILSIRGRLLSPSKHACRV